MQIISLRDFMHICKYRKCIYIYTYSVWFQGFAITACNYIVRLNSLWTQSPDKENERNQGQNENRMITIIRFSCNLVCFFQQKLCVM